MLPSFSVDHSYGVWLRHQWNGLLSDYLLTLTLIDEHFKSVWNMPLMAPLVFDIFLTEVQKSDRINTDRQSGSHQLGSNKTHNPFGG